MQGMSNIIKKTGLSAGNNYGASVNVTIAHYRPGQTLRAARR